MSARVDTRLHARAAVRVAARVLADRSHADLDAVVAALEALAYDTLTAERLALLVPLAFGRVALKARAVERFAWTVRIDAEDEAVLHLDLQREPVFLEALAYAVDSYDGRGVDEATAARLAADSPELDAAERAAAAGEDIVDARIHETVWRSRLAAAAWEAVGARA